MWKTVESGKYKNIEGMMLIINPDFTIFEGKHVILVVSYEVTKLPVWQGAMESTEEYEIDRDIQMIHIFDKSENLLIQLKYKTRMKDSIDANNVCVPVVKEIDDVLSVGYFSMDLFNLADVNAPCVDHDHFVSTWWENEHRVLDFSRLRQEYYKIEAIDENWDNLKLTKLPIPVHGVHSLNVLRYKGKKFGYTINTEIVAGVDAVNGVLVYDKEFNFVGCMDNKLMQFFVNSEPVYKHAEDTDDDYNFEYLEFTALTDSYLLSVNEDLISKLYDSCGDKSDDEISDITNEHMNRIYCSLIKGIVYDGDKPIFAIGNDVGNTIDFEISEDGNIEMKPIGIQVDEQGEIVDPFKELADNTGEIVVVMVGKNSNKEFLTHNFITEAIRVYTPGEDDAKETGISKLSDSFRKLWNIDLPHPCILEKSQNFDDVANQSLKDVRIKLLQLASEKLNSSKEFDRPIRLLYMDATEDSCEDDYSFSNMVNPEFCKNFEYSTESVQRKINESIEEYLDGFVDGIKSVINEQEAS